MKPRESAQQRNVSLDLNTYTYEQIEDLLATVPGVFSLFEVDGTPIEETSHRDYLEQTVVSLAHITNLYVGLDPYGYYRNVATMETGEHLYVIL